MPKIADRVIETTTSTGTSQAVLGGSVTNYRRFSDAFNDGDTLYYCMVGNSGWEVGIGSFDLALNRVIRVQPLRSSDGNSLVNFGPGTKNIFVTMPEEYFNDIVESSLALSIALG